MSTALHTETYEGFEINFYAEPETEDPTGYFASGDDALDAETVEMIRNGTYDWFVAKVTASKAGIVLGTDYLGGCCYDSARDFPTESGGYYEDMRDRAVSEALNTLESLCCAKDQS